MGQLTKEFVASLLLRAEQGKKTPLTAWEQQQLAHAWMQWHGHSRCVACELSAINDPRCAGMEHTCRTRP